MVRSRFLTVALTRVAFSVGWAASSLSFSSFISLHQKKGHQWPLCFSKLHLECDTTKASSNFQPASWSTTELLVTFSLGCKTTWPSGISTKSFLENLLLAKSWLVFETTRSKSPSLGVQETRQTLKAKTKNLCAHRATFNFEAKELLVFLVQEMLGLGPTKFSHHANTGL